MELIICTECILCSINTTLKNQLDAFVQANPGMERSVLYKNLHKICQHNVRILKNQSFQTVDIDIEAIRHHYENCKFFKENEIYNDLRQLNIIQKTLLDENKTEFKPRTVNLLLKCMEQRTRLIERLPQREFNIADSIPTWD